MACSAQQRPDGPLTAERQALVLQWMPYARGLASRYQRRHAGLAAHGEDLLAAAWLGLVVAARRWEPARAPFVTVASWWVRAALQRYFARSVYAVPVSGTDGFDRLRVASINTTVVTGPDGDAVDWQEQFPAAEADVPLEERLDAALHGAWLMRAARREVVRRMCRKGSREEASRIAARAFLERQQDNTPVALLAERYGVSRQAMDVALKKAGAAFESWAAEVRGES
ncbi:MULTISPECIES: sigma factor [unclassified Corallococcus]|uniref:sigma factor n=1 Tax=unclassified Corallococcus TaxID=2685029 RepID=UPI001A8EA808|nr:MULTISPECIES: sigma factor [unclassified Corallococcus]MBN9687142.1 hypothetical protein [Corallococcus sp. NCSPR001]WAS89031.1 sigma factor [Corallococcus sp. NCRR]